MKAHLSSALRAFINGCDRANNLCSIYGYLTGVAPPALHCDDILRSAHVLAVSSFDLYIHDVFRTEIVHRVQSRKEAKFFRIPFNAALIAGNAQTSLIEENIRKDNSFKSFVSPDKLADCLRSLIDSPWEEISSDIGYGVELCKVRLRRVVDLRNRIAHEADVNPSYGGIELWPIYREDVDQSILFLRDLGNSVANVVNRS